MFGTASKTSIWSSSSMILLAILATIVAAAPGNPNNEDALGSSGPRVYYRNPENIPSPDDNVIPISLDGGQPVLYDSQIQQPTDNAILNYLLARRLMMGNTRLRSYLNGIDTSSNEISRKRSYSKYCAFNAVSCFGK